MQLPPCDLYDIKDAVELDSENRVKEIRRENEGDWLEPQRIEIPCSLR